MMLAKEAKFVVTEKISDDARKLFRESLVWDMLLPWFPDNFEEIDWLLPRFRDFGINFFSLTIAHGPNMGIADTMRNLARIRSEIEERSDWLVLATDTRTVRDAKESGKLAAGLNFQDTCSFEATVEMVDIYYELGIRSALLAYNLRNMVADGCAEEANAGLSRFGRQIVQRMNKVGMLVDGSHTGFRSSMDAMELSSAPVIFSHSNPASVVPHYRNLTDEQIRRCAETGGVMGVNGVGRFLGDKDASTEALFRCVDYVSQLVGPRHVGIGFDYVWDLEKLNSWLGANSLMWPGSSSAGLDNFAEPEQTLELTQMMLDHGYKADDVKGILGANWERVCGEVWK